ncbi:MAG: ABC transporter permease, partial [Prevotella sp.]|nr:ABC transporter permease [Prevotella sp.]
MKKRLFGSGHLEKYRKEWMLVAVFALEFIICGVLSPSDFLSWRNMQSLAFQIPEIGIISLAMMVVIITGGINLSIATCAALSSIIAAYTLSGLNGSGLSDWVIIIFSIIVAILSASICGLFNGAVVAYVGVSPILVTIGTMTLFQGIGLYFTHGKAISGFNESFYVFGNEKFAGIPISMIIFAVIAFVTWILLEKTPWGLYIHMLGCNRRATEFSGVNVKKALLKAYILSSIIGSIAAIIMMSRYNSAKVDYGSSYLMLSITATV